MGTRHRPHGGRRRHRRRRHRCRLRRHRHRHCRHHRHRRHRPRRGGTRLPSLPPARAPLKCLWLQRRHCCGLHIRRRRRGGPHHPHRRRCQRHQSAGAIQAGRASRAASERASADAVRMAAACAAAATVPPATRARGVSSRRARRAATDTELATESDARVRTAGRVWRANGARVLLRAASMASALTASAAALRGGPDRGATRQCAPLNATSAGCACAITRARAPRATPAPTAPDASAPEGAPMAASACHPQSAHASTVEVAPTARCARAGSAARAAGYASTAPAGAPQVTLARGANEPRAPPPRCRAWRARRTASVSRRAVRATPAGKARTARGRSARTAVVRASASAVDASAPPGGTARVASTPVPSAPTGACAPDEACVPLCPAAWGRRSSPLPEQAGQLAVTPPSPPPLARCPSRTTTLPLQSLLWRSDSHQAHHRRRRPQAAARSCPYPHQGPKYRHPRHATASLAGTATPAGSVHAPISATAAAAAWAADASAPRMRLATTVAGGEAPRHPLHRRAPSVHLGTRCPVCHPPVRTPAYCPALRRVRRRWGRNDAEALA